MEKIIRNIIAFLNAIEKLKSTLRHSFTSTGRQESVAEHCWRMAIMGMVLGKYFPKTNISKVIKMCLVHDLGEVYDGDIPVFDKNKTHELKETEAIKQVIEPLSNDLRKEIILLCQEFDACKTKEAQLAKAIDKLEVLIQHNEADLSTWTQQEYSFNLTYGRDHHQFNEFIRNFRKIVDEMTLAKTKQEEKQ